MKVAGIVLAAGESRRMGRAKMTLPFGDSTLLETVIGALEEAVDSVTVVLGRNWEEVSATIAHRNVETFVNPRPEGGMLSSAQWALAQLQDEADAFLFALGDQPRIQPTVVETLLAAAERSVKGIVLPIYAGKRGHPVLFRARYKQAILALPLTMGLNAIARAHPDDVEEVPVDTPSIHQDIDTPEDYARLRIDG